MVVCVGENKRVCVGNTVRERMVIVLTCVECMPAAQVKRARERRNKKERRIFLYCDLREKRDSCRVWVYRVGDRVQFVTVLVLKEIFSFSQILA